MCGKSGSGSNGNTSTQTNMLPPEVAQAYSSLLSRGTAAANRPFQPYTDPLVAGFNPTQTAAFGNINDSQGIANPFFNTASQYAGIGAAPIAGNVAQWSPEQMAQYMSPYTQSVVDATSSNLNENDALQRSALRGNAISAGAFGGDRAGVAQAELARNQNLARGQTIGNLYEQGYGQAFSAFGADRDAMQRAMEGDASRAANASYQFGALGESAQNSALQGASAQLQAGGLQQQLEQQQLNEQYRQFQQEQNYPFMTSEFLSRLVSGSPAAGSITTTTPGPSTLGQIGGLGIAGLALAGATGGFGDAGWLSKLGGRRGGRVPRAGGGPAYGIPIPQLGTSARAPIPISAGLTNPWSYSWTPPTVTPPPVIPAPPSGVPGLDVIGGGRPPGGSTPANDPGGSDVPYYPGGPYWTPLAAFGTANATGEGAGIPAGGGGSGGIGGTGNIVDEFRVPNATTLGIPKAASVAGSMLIPGVGYLNLPGNLYNTTNNAALMKEFGQPLSAWQQLGGYLGLNAYSGTADQALAAQVDEAVKNKNWDLIDYLAGTNKGTVYGKDLETYGPGGGGYMPIPGETSTVGSTWAPGIVPPSGISVEPLPIPEEMLQDMFNAEDPNWIDTRKPEIDELNREHAISPGLSPMTIDTSGGPESATDYTGTSYGDGAVDFNEISQDIQDGTYTNSYDYGDTPSMGDSWGSSMDSFWKRGGRAPRAMGGIAGAPNLMAAFARRPGRAEGGPSPTAPSFGASDPMSLQNTPWWVPVAAAGFGAAASKSPNALGAVGEGGLAGLQAYISTRKADAEANDRAAAMRDRQRQTEIADAAQKSTATYQVGQLAAKDNLVQAKLNIAQDNIDAKIKEAEMRGATAEEVARIRAQGDLDKAAIAAGATVTASENRKDATLGAAEIGADARLAAARIAGDTALAVATQRGLDAKERAEIAADAAMKVARERGGSNEEVARIGAEMREKVAKLQTAAKTPIAAELDGKKGNMAFSPETGRWEFSAGTTPIERGAGSSMSATEFKFNAFLAAYPEDKQGALDYAAGKKEMTEAEIITSAQKMAAGEAKTMWTPPKGGFPAYIAQRAKEIGEQLRATKRPAPTPAPAGVPDRPARRVIELPGQVAPSPAPAGAAPQLPPGVPSGSQYSASRKQWRDLSGKLYDASGKPVQ